MKKLITLLLLVISPVSLAAPSASPLSGERLYERVKTYAAFGDHRTASRADLATADWLANSLAETGFAVERQPFSLRQFTAARHTLQLGSQSLQVFPHWLPATGSVEGPLRAFDEKDLNGAIAFLTTDKAGLWYQLSPNDLAEEAARRGAKALVIAVPHPSGEIYMTNARPPYLQKTLPIPTAIVAASDQKAINDSIGKAAMLVIEGSIEQQQAHNIIARYPAEALADRPTVIISTPISGWFQCAGERGGGVALWLGLAEWVSSQPNNINWVFVANSGHELSFMGAHKSLPLMPPANEVTLWFHLGASIGARQWQQDSEGQLIPLDKVHEYNQMFSTDAVMPAIEQAFGQVPDLSLLPTSALRRGHSELVSISKQGYPAAGIVGSHRFFHTPEDTPAVTSPALLAPYGQALKALANNLNNH